MCIAAVAKSENLFAFEGNKKITEHFFPIKEKRQNLWAKHWQKRRVSSDVTSEMLALDVTSGTKRADVAFEKTSHPIVPLWRVHIMVSQKYTR